MTRADVFFHVEVVNAMVERDDLHATRPSRVRCRCGVSVGVEGRGALKQGGSMEEKHQAGRMGPMSST